MNPGNAIEAENAQRFKAHPPCHSRSVTGAAGCWGSGLKTRATWGSRIRAGTPALRSMERPPALRRVAVRIGRYDDTDP